MDNVLITYEDIRKLVEAAERVLSYPEAQTSANPGVEPLRLATRRMQALLRAATAI